MNEIDALGMGMSRCKIKTVVASKIGACNATPADLFFHGVGIDRDDDMVNKSLKYVLKVDRDGFLNQLNYDRFGDKIIEYLNNK